VEERMERHLTHTLTESGDFGNYIKATIHAKPNLVVCPLLEHTSGDQDITEQPSASQIACLVRQQALLMYPKIDSIQGITVHYINQRKVTVDVNMATKSTTKSVKQVRQDAQELQTSLQQLDEIEHANIYLDLLNTDQCDDDDDHVDKLEEAKATIMEQLAKSIAPTILHAEALLTNATATNSNTNSNTNTNTNTNTTTLMAP
jgi:hypothetical protein